MVWFEGIGQTQNRTTGLVQNGHVQVQTRFGPRTRSKFAGNINKLHKAYLRYEMIVVGECNRFGGRERVWARVHANTRVQVQETT